MASGTTDARKSNARRNRRTARSGYHLVAVVLLIILIFTLLDLLLFEPAAP